MVKVSYKSKAQDILGANCENKTNHYLNYLGKYFFYWHELRKQDKEIKTTSRKHKPNRRQKVNRKYKLSKLERLVMPHILNTQYKRAEWCLDFAIKNNTKVKYHLEWHISLDPLSSYYYALQVLKGRFELGEKVILASEYAERYKALFHI